MIKIAKRKSIEEFKKEVFDLVGNEYEVLSEEYINCHTKLKMKHNLCNRIYEVTPNVFIQGSRCPHCSKLYRMNNEEFIKKFNNKYNGEYILLSKYKNSRTKIEIMHRLCGKKFTIIPNNMMNNNYICPQCKILKNNYFQKEFNKNYGNNFELLDSNNYENKNSIIKIRCKKCNDEFNIKYSNMNKIKNICKNCYKIEKINNYLKLNKNEISFSKLLDNNFIEFYHENCDKFFSKEIKNYSIIKNMICPYCKKSKSQKEFEREVFNLVGNEYTILSNYIKNDIKIEFRHNNCGKTFLMRPMNFINLGNRCPHCNRSIGEEIIEDYLIENSIIYKTQVSFSDCKYINKLHFDFQLFLNNNIILVEYDGIQHFKNTFYSKSFNKQKMRDNIKNEYCKNKNYHLYRISYKDNIINSVKNIIEKESSTTIH